MKRIAIGMLIGLAIGGGGMALATSLVTVIPPAGIAVVQDPGTNNGTQIRFQHLDLVCLYYRSNGPGPEQNLKNEPQVECSRGPFASATFNNSRRVTITPYRYFMRDAAGDITYSVTRTP